jgi:hypothetical protein
LTKLSVFPPILGRAKVPVALPELYWPSARNIVLPDVTGDAKVIVRVKLEPDPATVPLPDADWTIAMATIAQPAN